MTNSKCSSIGYVTLVGYMSKEYPLEYGNCFSVSEENTNTSYRIVNFNYENFSKLLNDKIIEFPVGIKILSEKVAIIHDSRIPDNWYQTRWCQTCCPTNLLPFPQQLEQERQIESGRRKEIPYDNEGGFLISHNMNKGPKKYYKGKWYNADEQPEFENMKKYSIEPQQELKSECGDGLEELLLENIKKEVEDRIKNGESKDQILLNLIDKYGKEDIDKGFFYAPYEVSFSSYNPSLSGS